MSDSTSNVRCYFEEYVREEDSDASIFCRSPVPNDYQVIENYIPDPLPLTEITNELTSSNIQYKILKRGSERGMDVLASSDGYSYVRTRVRNDTIYWRCPLRRTSFTCNATVVSAPSITIEFPVTDLVY